MAKRVKQAKVFVNEDHREGFGSRVNNTDVLSSMIEYDS